MIEFAKASLMSVGDTKDLLASDFANLLQSERFILGEEVSAFESEFAGYLGADYCIGVGNGTDALELAMRAVGVGFGSKVATVGNAGNYTSTASKLVGAEPVYMDVSSDTGLVTLSEVERCLAEDQPDAIVVTHLYGRIAPEIREIVEVARKHGTPLIEDCSQAHGAILGGKRAGTFGLIGTFSHYPTKNLGGLGDGGSIATSSREINLRLRRLRQYGWGQKYESTELGRNSRLDELQASFLRRLLPYLDGENKIRSSIAQRYFQRIVPVPGLLGHFKWTWGDSYVGHLFPIRVEPDHRKSLQAYLDSNGIGHAIHFPIPDHKQNGSEFKDVLPNTERLCNSVLSLPMHTGLSNQDVESVTRVVNEWVALQRSREMDSRLNGE